MQSKTSYIKYLTTHPHTPGICFSRLQCKNIVKDRKS